MNTTGSDKCMPRAIAIGIEYCEMQLSGDARKYRSMRRSCHNQREKAEKLMIEAGVTKTMNYTGDDLAEFQVP